MRIKIVEWREEDDPSIGCFMIERGLKSEDEMYGFCTKPERKRALALARAAALKHSREEDLDIVEELF